MWRRQESQGTIHGRNPAAFRLFSLTSLGITLHPNCLWNVKSYVNLIQGSQEFNKSKQITSKASYGLLTHNGNGTATGTRTGTIGNNTSWSLSLYRNTGNISTCYDTLCLVPVPVPVPISCSVSLPCDLPGLEVYPQPRAGVLFYIWTLGVYAGTAG